ncbi:hypothetical protein DAI22_07g226300 [Oryza sativa Japonica Group]|nr:hypothetical protein DAI22_07g226300 [Oryza sativa Japonica Group]
MAPVTGISPSRLGRPRQPNPFFPSRHWLHGSTVTEQPSELEFREIKLIFFSSLRSHYHRGRQCSGYIFCKVMQIDCMGKLHHGVKTGGAKASISL